jgi:GT2 family glycosyltransferase
MDEHVDAAEIGVVIVNWNGGQLVVDCLKSLQANPPSAPWEAILVDNASSDGSPQRVQDELPWVRVIVNDHNRGLAAANNQGLRASLAPFPLIANPDVLFRTGAIDALHALMRRHDRAAFAFARLRDPDGRIQTCAGDLPTMRDALLGRWLGGHRGQQSGPVGFWWHGWDHADEARIGHGGEACYLVRRTAIEQIGLQDEKFELDWEGIDWTARARDAGWDAWFCPDADVVHVGGVSLKQVPFRWIVSTHRGMYHYFRGRVPPIARPAVAGAISLRATVKLVLAALSPRVYERAH